jgi:hypothetical protein
MTSPENLGRQFDDHIMVPIHEVEEFVPSDFEDGDWSNPIRMKHIYKETFDNSGEVTPERYNRLRKSIAKHGIKEPVNAVLRDDGHTVLTEGHHRVVFGRMAGLTHIPVRFS